MKSKSSIIKIAVLVVALGALLAVFFLLKNKDKKPTDPGNKTEYFTVTTIDVDKVDRIYLKNDSYEAVFTKDGEKWINEDDLLNQAIVNQFTDKMLPNLLALSKVTEPAAASEYGLDHPAVLEAYAGSERLVKIELGDKLPTNANYYCRFNDEKTVYTVSSSYSQLILRDKSYFVNKLTLPSISAIKNITEISLTGTLFPAFTAKKGNNFYDYSGINYLPWYSEEPYRAQWEADIPGTTWMDQLEQYLNIYTESVRAARPDEFAKYGLNDPQAVLTVKYTDDSGTESRSYTLKIGEQDAETGSYYAMLQGRDAIITISKAQVELMCNFDVFSYTYHALFYPGMRAISSLTVTFDDKALTYTHETVGEEEVYRMNGTQITSKEALEWMNLITGLRTTGYKPTETPDAEPILTFEVKAADPTKNKDMTVRIFRGEGGSDIVERLGVCDCLIDSRAVDDFIKMMKGMTEN
ncbi:MAG: DUF4340 domain-containing protein [Lachnospiraceae bacterium]|nr:DUF4340 domain-containing protein [Lachnospiraceae bacterium]